MGKLPTWKLYSLVFIILHVGGTLWSIINGYRYFCEGLHPCDNNGVVLSWDVFFRRELFSIFWVSVMSGFITFMLVKDKGDKENEEE